MAEVLLPGVAVLQCEGRLGHQGHRAIPGHLARTEGKVRPVLLALLEIRIITTIIPKTREWVELCRSSSPYCGRSSRAGQTRRCYRQTVAHLHHRQEGTEGRGRGPLVASRWMLHQIMHLVDHLHHHRQSWDML